MAYEVTIKSANIELTPKQRIQLKDTTDAVKLDSATQGGNTLCIVPSFHAVLDIHNDKSEDKDYKNYVIVAKDGTRYVTGSESFWNSYMNIYNEMADEPEEWSLKIYRMPSKNRAGKDFITCSLV